MDVSEYTVQLGTTLWKWPVVELFWDLCRRQVTPGADLSLQVKLCHFRLPPLQVQNWLDLLCMCDLGIGQYLPVICRSPRLVAVGCLTCT